MSTLELYFNNITEFYPKRKRKKFKRKQLEDKPYVLEAPNEEAERNYIGNICIGTTNNTLETYEECTAILKSSNDHDHLILNLDHTTLVVNLAFDIKVLKDIFSSKVFAYKFLIVEEQFFLSLYFITLSPITFTEKLCKVIKVIFNLVFDCAVELQGKSKKKVLADPKDVLLLYKSLKDKREKLVHNEENLQHAYLKPMLYTYQADAVQWMLHRERNTCKNRLLNPLFEPVQLPAGITIYYNKYSGFFQVEEPLIDPLRTGGILADEMGLGKTVEVLACILNNPLFKYDMDNIENINQSVNVEYVSRKRTMSPTLDEESYVSSSKKLKTIVQKSNYMLLSDWYKEVLESTKGSKVRDKRRVACICGNTTTENVSECVDCSKLQHNVCVGYEKYFGEFLCSQCWNKKPTEPCKGTLIICPVSLQKQWIDEILRHVKGNISVLIYERHPQSAIYPTALKNYDLVITTYTVLQNELRLAENVEIRNLRNPPKYCQGGSPIVNMKWWRLCLDEAQVIENRLMVSEMARRIDAEHRWAITGTPISKNMSDIFALINYLQIQPYSDEFAWEELLHKPYLNGNLKPMFNFLSKIMWRTCKIDVLSQIKIPNQKVEEHWLEFTQVERYFYDREYDVRYSDFIRKLKNYDQDMPLKSLDNRSFKEIWTPFLALRQACVHHNAIKGRYLTTRKPVSSMDNLLEALIEKNVLENEEHLRVLISTLNGLAGIQLLLQNPKAATVEYKKALKLIEKYTVKQDPVALNVDMLQIIHILHNLSEMLKGFQELDEENESDTFRNQCEDYEKKYIEKHNKMNHKIYVDLKEEEKVIIKLEGEFFIEKHGWYADAMDYIIRNNYWNDFNTKFETFCQQAALNDDKFANGSGEALYSVTAWDDTITNLRKDILNKFSCIYNADENQFIIPQKIVNAAMNCHLRPNQVKGKKKQDCPLCKAITKLKLYEAKLFSKKENDKAAANVGVYKCNPEEVWLRALYQTIKAKGAHNDMEDVLADGKRHLKLLEAIKSEFKVLSKFYLYIDTEISCKDEINMCKMRFSIKETNNESTATDRRVQSILKQLELNLTQRNLHEIEENQLDYQKTILHNQEMQQMEHLERNLGTYGYLNTLKGQQFKGQKPDPCPICRSVLDKHWNILKCGHCYCIECMQVLIGRVKEKHITCSICRQRQHTRDLSYVHLDSKTPSASEIKGNVSTKLEAVVRLILRLRKDDESVKILIFSTWSTILSMLQNVLQVNGILSELIKNQYMDKQLNNFKDEMKGVTTLLMPINLGGKGLNIVEASHIIFLEALADVGEELQAIGRIHRIGQMRETTVHKFLIRSTIEEEIHNAVTLDASKWNQNTVTLRQILFLFNKNT